MNNFKTHPFSTVLGFLIIVFSGVLLFTPTLYDIPLWGILLIFVSGILLLFAEDKFISILTLGLSRFVKSKTDLSNSSVQRFDTGGHPDPKKEEK